MYAVNIADLTKPDVRTIAPYLVSPVTPSRTVVQTERDRFDGMGIVLECPNEQAAAIVEVIRLKFKRHELRCYKGNGKTWKRI